MNSYPTKFGIGFSGQAVGTSTNTQINTTVGKVARTSATGANWQAYDAATRVPLTIVAGGTTTLNLSAGTITVTGPTTTNMLNPLGEQVSLFPFAHVYAFLVWHDSASLASGITAFGGASGNLFQGPLNSTGQFTLAPGMRNGFSQDANIVPTLWVVSPTVKNVDITNSDGTHAATVNVYIQGTTN